MMTPAQRAALEAALAALRAPELPSLGKPAPKNFQALEKSGAAGKSAAAAPRWQDRLMEELIPRGASVLDLGCGGGQLLQKLLRDQAVRAQGVELNPAAVMECVGRGVPVLQADLDDGLKGFDAGSFDYVVLEETLQTVRQPLRLLDEMLRIGRNGMVSFPNFGHWRVRLSLAADGRMPVTPRLPYRWHDTPNIHLFTLQDFLDWLAGGRARVAQSWMLCDGEVRAPRPDDPLYAEECLFLLTAAPHGD